MVFFVRPSVVYAECHIFSYAECRIFSYADCRIFNYAECHFTECCFIECFAPLLQHMNKGSILFVPGLPLSK